MRSVFVKLLAVTLVVCLVVMAAAVFGFTHMFRENAAEFFDSGYRRLAAFLADTLGDDPTVERGRRLAERLWMRIGYRGASGEWYADAPMTAKDEPEGSSPTIAEMEKFVAANGRYAHFYRGRFYILYKREDRTWLFMTMRGRFLNHFMVTIVAFPLLLVVVFGLGFVVIRRILSPLKTFSAALASVSTGRFDVRLDQDRQDELGRLAMAFNEMTDRIGGMIRSREQLLYDVSHELRSPLTRVRLGIELLPPSGTRDGIRDDVRLLDAMIEELLESARLDSEHGGLKYARVDLGDLVPAEPGVEATIATPDGMAPVIWADRHRLDRLIRNLLDNALRYTNPAAGPVVVTIGVDGACAAISVRDRGPGIPEDARTAVFEPFYRVDPSRDRSSGGYGLGLALCRKIVHAHRGTIVVANPGEPGAEILVTLPTEPCR